MRSEDLRLAGAVVLAAFILAAPAIAAEAAPATAAVTDATINTDAEINQGYAPQDGDSLVSHILGAHVFSSAAADADDFGIVSDIVLDQNGDVQVVVLKVGASLGIGEKSVAVDYADFKVGKGADGKDRFILKATKAAFAAAPDFSFAGAKAKLPSSSAPISTSAK